MYLLVFYSLCKIYLVVDHKPKHKCVLSVEWSFMLHHQARAVHHNYNIFSPNSHIYIPHIHIAFHLCIIVYTILYCISFVWRNIKRMIQTHKPTPHIFYTHQNQTIVCSHRALKSHARIRIYVMKVAQTCARVRATAARCGRRRGKSEGVAFANLICIALRAMRACLTRIYVHTLHAWLLVYRVKYTIA